MRFEVIEFPGSLRPSYAVVDMAHNTPVVLFTTHNFGAAEWLAQTLEKSPLPPVFDLPGAPSQEPF